MTSGEAFEPEDPKTLDRCLDFVIAAERRAAEQIAELDAISSLLSPSIPDVWDANKLIIERPGITAPGIIDETDRGIGGAGMQHRTTFMRDCNQGRHLAPEFERIGWTAERGVLMEMRREPDKPSDIEDFETSIDPVEGLQRSMIAG